MTDIISVQTGRAYKIHLEPGILSQTGKLAAQIAHSRQAVIVTDTNVAPLYEGQVKQSLEQAGFTVFSHAFKAGEESKNANTLLELYAFFAKCDMTRSDLVVALGGGVVGDVAGFAAASYMRGIDFIQIPTTLLAQVDSSVGGKTAIDLPQGKNLVGAFWQPRLVVCDPLVLQTLDKENFSCGMGEIIKHACIRSTPLFKKLVDCQNIQAELPEIIGENVRIKRDVVERDEREKGERMLLNFGHTLGHALEKCLHYKGLSHGAAISIGMCLITRRAEQLGLSPRGTADKIAVLLKKYDLPTQSTVPMDKLSVAAQNDKKRAGNSIHLVLLHKIGDAFVHTLPVAKLENFLGIAS